MTHFVDKYDGENKKIDVALAKFVFDCNLPLLKDIMKTIELAYFNNIPGRKKPLYLKKKKKNALKNILIILRKALHNRYPNQ